MNNQVTIDKRFCGPPESGNGGYVCGVLAKYVDGIAEATLRKPPPLNRPMTIEQNDDGSAQLKLEGELIGHVESATLELDVPDAPTLDAAKEAVQRYTGFEQHIFPTCFVCGPEREEGDALRIFAGDVGADSMVAAPWTPHESLADESGNIGKEYIWAALDCPGAFSIARLDEIPMVLGRLVAEQVRPVSANETYVVAGWPVSSDGRKHYAGTAVFNASGELCARAKATWIALKQT